VAAVVDRMESWSRLTFEFLAGERSVGLSRAPADL
jgi:hypothetical protein